jgi:hypothetical protein
MLDLMGNNTLSIIDLLHLVLLVISITLLIIVHGYAAKETATFQHLCRPESKEARFTLAAAVTAIKPVRASYYVVSWIDHDALVPRFTLKGMTHHHHTIAGSKDPFLLSRGLHKHPSTSPPTWGGDAKQQRLTTVPASCKKSFD